jgi:hypothetical protein
MALYVHNWYDWMNFLCIRNVQFVCQVANLFNNFKWTNLLLRQLMWYLLRQMVSWFDRIWKVDIDYITNLKWNRSMFLVILNKHLCLSKYQHMSHLVM